MSESAGDLAERGQRPRRIGRPRATEIEATDDPRRTILVAASRIFSERGYEATRMADIAAAAGLRTPSLYHYFRAKDDILHELALHSVEQSAAFATDLVVEHSAAPGLLYRLLRNHIDHLTSGPFDLWFLIDLSVRQAMTVPHVQRAYATWENAIVTLLARGVAEEDFLPLEPGFALQMTIGAVYGALGMQSKAKPANIAHETAAFVLRALCADSEIAAHAIEAEQC